MRSIAMHVYQITHSAKLHNMCDLSSNETIIQKKDVIPVAYGYPLATPGSVHPGCPLPLPPGSSWWYVWNASYVRNVRNPNNVVDNP